MARRLGSRGLENIRLAAGVAALALASSAHAQGAGALPDQPVAPSVAGETHVLPGLKAPGRVVVDRWGIAHIYAGTQADAFFLQGWNAARDRLWQIDLWRKRGLGRLSASFGAGFAEQDRATRLLLYRGDIKAEWAAYPAEARGWTEAFANGVNAYIAEVEAGRQKLPEEFALTSTKPERWSAEDVVRIRSNALVSNAVSEALRARAVCKGSLPLETLRRRLEPAHEPQVPKGLDPCLIGDDAMRTYTLATQEVSFDGVKLAAAAPETLLALQDRAEQREGSNNWVVAPGHSASGRAILANDPHRAHSAPSLRYVVDVSAPGLHFAGAGEPALPGITFGHNDTTAWGITIFYADQEDLYLYKTDKAHPGAYFHGGKWVPFEVVREALPVKGEGDRTVELKYTLHGPVIWQDEAKGVALALRSVWARPGASAYFNAAWMLKATGWDDFERAHQHWGAPPLNLVYADVTGQIGWRPSAFVPKRKGWDGLMPVPGDGRYEWQGMIPPGQLPMLRNPARGWIATANEMNVPAAYPMASQPIGYEWVDRSRIDRIETLLAAKPKLDLRDMMAIQTDVTSPLAKRTVGLLAGLAPADKDAAAAVSLLKGWDGFEGINSAQAALYEIWTSRHLRAALADAVGKPDLRPFLREAQHAAVVDWLERADPRLGADPRALREAVLTGSLAAAWRDAAKRLGPDPKLWRWGDLHQAEWLPSVAKLAPAGQRTQWAVGPLQTGGSGSTPMATTYRGGGFGVSSGASVRLVLDVGAWDNAMVINTPGQSGDPQSAHYRDLFPRWAAGDYVPFLYSPQAVAGAAEKVIEVKPQ